MFRQKKILVIGIGNPLRGDDGIGAYICGRIDALKQPQITTLRVHQLQTELLETLIAFDAVLIADAAADGREITIKPVSATGHPMRGSHYCHPALLKGLAKELYHTELPLYVCGVPVQGFQMGAPLSDSARNNAEIAVQKIIHWIGECNGLRSTP